MVKYNNFVGQSMRPLVSNEPQAMNCFSNDQAKGYFVYLISGREIREIMYVTMNDENDNNGTIRNKTKRFTIRNSPNTIEACSWIPKIHEQRKLTHDLTTSDQAKDD